MYRRPLFPFPVKIRLLILIFFSMLMLWMMKSNKSKDTNPEIEKGKKCFKLPDAFDADDIDFLEDVLKSKIQPDKTKSIFLHETSCFKNGIIDMTAR